MNNNMEILVDPSIDEGVFVCNDCSKTWSNPLTKETCNMEEEYSPLCISCMEPAW